MLGITKLERLPVTEAELEAYRIDARRRPTTGQMGGHVVRRLGDSLDFAEYVHYQPGADVRHVDWRASSRPDWRSAIHPSSGWLVRRFDAEEQLKIVISLDTRPTLHALPRDISKHQIAAWLAEAVSFVALRSGDEVVLHRLFGQPLLRSRRLRGPSSLNRLHGMLEEVAERVSEDAQINVAGLERELPPAAVWIIISDLYFDSAHLSRLAEHVAAARRGKRWIILVELDSWPYERALLGRGLWRILGPEGERPNPVSVGVQGNDPIIQVEERLNQHRLAALKALQGPSLSHTQWSWPMPKGPNGKKKEAGEFFRARFEADKTIQLLWRRVPWR